jgi:hypothetical protein
MAQAASTAPSALSEQAITARLTVEVMHDLDDGTPTLVASTQGNQGDLQVVTVAQLRAAITEQRAVLNRQERLALAYEAATTKAPTGEPHAWTVADYDSGLPLNVTCMSGCNTLHAERSIGMSRAVDVKCAQYDTANTVELQIGCSGENFGGYATLSVEIKSDPVHPDPAKRVPVAAIEVTEDHYIEDLDPNALAVVIDKLDQRVAAMRVRHADLVRIRNEHFGRQA